MKSKETIEKAEKLMTEIMKENDSSHDAWHVFRVRDLSLSLAREEGLSCFPDSMEVVSIIAEEEESFRFYEAIIVLFSSPEFVLRCDWQVELAALLHDIGR